MRRTTTWVAGVLALVALWGCGGARTARYQAAEMDFGAIRTVAVLPFQNLSRDTAAGERVRDVFANRLLASEAFYVVPQGEVLRGVARTGVTNPTAPSVEEIIKLGKQLQAGAVVTGVVREYGEIRSGSNTANVVSLSVQMLETETGQVVWAASSTKGGVTMLMRMFGSGGTPVNDVTEEAVDDLLDQLFD